MMIWTYPEKDWVLKDGAGLFQLRLSYIQRRRNKIFIREGPANLREVYEAYAVTSGTKL